MFMQFLDWCGLILLHGGIWFLCILGILLSCLSFSGPWLITGASVLAWLLVDSAFPTGLICAGFAVAAGMAEVIEFFAGAWGVTRRGGSGWTGFAALAGGLLGLFLGTMIPVPVVGSLLGMLAGSFGLAFWAEYHLQKKADRAAHIAFGAVTARILVIFMKTALSVALSVILLFNMYRTLL